MTAGRLHFSAGRFPSDMKSVALLHRIFGVYGHLSL